MAIPSILSMGQIMFTCFHRVSPCHLPFSNVICNIDVAVYFDTFEIVIVLSWFPMTSLSCDCHVTRNHKVIHPSSDL